MLGEKTRHARDARALRQFVKRCVPFPKCDDLMLVVQRGQQISKAPHAAQIDSARRETTLLPSRFETCSGRCRFLPRGIRDFEQIATMRTAKVLAGNIVDVAASDAAESEILLAHFRAGTGDQ